MATATKEVTAPLIPWWLVLLQGIAILLVVLFPQLALWLPSLIIK